MQTYRANSQYEFVEIVVPAGSPQTTFNFPDLPQIRTTPIFSITCYTPALLTASAITFQPIIPLAALKQAFLTLYTTDPLTGVEKNAVNRLPLTELIYINDLTSPYQWMMPEFAGQTVVWPKSFIQFATVVGNVANNVICLGIRYGNPMKVQQ